MNLTFRCLLVACWVGGPALAAPCDADDDGFLEVGSCGGADCDDSDASVHPGAVETVNGRDDDCNGVADDKTRVTDDDGDGFAEDGGDCDDTDASIHPAAVETCDGVDTDCDSVIDDGTSCHDDDGDGYCEDAVSCGDGALPGDCHDGDASVRPGGNDPHNGVDDNCDGVVDDGVVDSDGDGFLPGTEANCLAWSMPLNGDGTCGDCRPLDGASYPGAPEVLDSVDNDCDGVTDEGTSGYDDDGDGYSEDAGDCDDADASVHPAAADIPDDGIDQDCDGVLNQPSWVDDDGDGVSEKGGDCDDHNRSVWPGAVEVPNGVDDDCDGVIDPPDWDADGVTEEEGDCDDWNGWVSPLLDEVCGDELDNNCDGQADEGCADEPARRERKDEPGCRHVGGVGGWGVVAGLALGLRRRGPGQSPVTWASVGTPATSE